MSKKIKSQPQTTTQKQTSTDASSERNPISVLIHEYMEKTPSKLKVIDAFLVYCLSTALIQIVYCGIVGSFPKNSFLSGVLISIGLFVLGVSLRKQLNNDERDVFKNILPERAWVDFVVAGVLVLLVGVNYMG